MMGRFKGSRGVGSLIVLLLAGGVAGSLVSLFLAASMPILHFLKVLALHPTTVDLGFVTLTFGFSLQVSLGTVAGMVAGYLAFKWL